MKTSPLVTIVIPTYNRASILAETLASTCGLLYPQDRLECIVVDDGSKDETPNVLHTFERNTPFAFRHLRQQNRGPAAARNLGVRHAQGEYIAFTDDDCTVHPQWLNELLAGFDGDQVAAVGGAVHSRSRNLVALYQEHRQIFRANLSGEEVPPFVITGNSCYRRQSFLEVDGFDEAIKHPGGEDPDLSWRIVAKGYQLRFTANAIVYHLHETHLRDIWRSNYYYGQGHRFITRKHGLASTDRIDWPSLWRLLSPRHFAYRVKCYLRDDQLDWRKATTFAVLDSVSGLAWMVGHSSQN